MFLLIILNESRRDRHLSSLACLRGIATLNELACVEFHAEGYETLKN
jgi:hypothetical protein